MLKSQFATRFAMLLIFFVVGYATPKSVRIQESPKKDTLDVAIPDGTEIIVLLEDDISSGSATEGDPVHFKVKDDFKIFGKTVIAKDALVKGRIANAEKDGRPGKGGKLGIRVESTTTVDGQKLRLRASKGGDKDAMVIALYGSSGLFGLLKKGKNATIKKGTEIKTYTDEEKVVRIPA